MEQELLGSCRASVDYHVSRRTYHYLLHVSIRTGGPSHIEPENDRAEDWLNEQGYHTLAAEAADGSDLDSTLGPRRYPDVGAQH